MHNNSRFFFLSQHVAAKSLAIIVPFFLFFFQSAAQSRLETPIKLKIEDGDFSEVSVVMNNITTGETNTVPGIARFELELKMNCDYVISFSKPGYITKKIALNTTAPADRVSQGFYPFNFEVVLFKQYEGVNIVIFNQPVGKISFNRLIDDFDYDTDYTKQIQSALKTAEEEIKKKQQESKVLAQQMLKEAEKKKAEEAAQAKAAAKATLEAEKKAAEEARIQAIEAAAAKKAQEEQLKKEAKATAEAERQRALAQMEEEERAKAKAAEAEEERRKSTANTGNDIPPASKPQGNGEESRPGLGANTGFDPSVTASVSGSGEDMAVRKSGKGTGIDDKESTLADPNKRNEKGMLKAVANVGVDNRPDAKPAVEKGFVSEPATEPAYEVLPDISVEEISELNRKITRVTVRKNDKETVFSKVVYNWGGIFYFRQNISVSESLYFMNTGRR